MKIDLGFLTQILCICCHFILYSSKVYVSYVCYLVISFNWKRFNIVAPSNLLRLVLLHYEKKEFRGGGMDGLLSRSNQKGLGKGLTILFRISSEIANNSIIVVHCCVVTSAVLPYSCPRWKGTVSAAGTEFWARPDHLHHIKTGWRSRRCPSPSDHIEPPDPPDALWHT